MSAENFPRCFHRSEFDERQQEWHVAGLTDVMRGDVLELLDENGERIVAYYYVENNGFWWKILNSP